MFDTDLPIYELLEPIRQFLTCANELVLEAPPGAGKTTQVPLALMHAEWLDGQRIIMLQPRRMAARASAQRMAQLLGESVGVTVGYRVRGDTQVGRGGTGTRIEVVTEGILTRMLQSDPALDGVGLVIFDEFHERNLDSDLGLALVLQARELLREPQDPLKILVMSATLDGDSVAKLLGNAPVLRCEGRQFPVAVHYRAPWRARQSIVERVVPEIEALAADEGAGSILVFLPGQGEIERVRNALNLPGEIAVMPLYGALELSRQQAAIMSPESGQRKVVLATNIAETSLTIDGIGCVIDSGLARHPHYDQRTGMTRLTLGRISRASSIQRMGRAGRVGPGRCVRLWSEEQQQQLEPASVPEIRQADLAPLALQLLRWGVADPSELQWLDVPPSGPYARALQLLTTLGAVHQLEGLSRLTAHGEAMAMLPLHPRLAHMLLQSVQWGLVENACLLAAVFSERQPQTITGVDIERRLAALDSGNASQLSRSGWANRVRQQASSYRKLMLEPERHIAVDATDITGLLLATAWPDRVARALEGEPGRYQLSNGRQVTLGAEDELARNEWLAVAELGAKSGSATDRIYCAAALEPMLFDHALAGLCRVQDTIAWGDRNERLLAQRQRLLGTLVLSSKRLENVPVAARSAATMSYIRERGLALLPWNNDSRQWQARVMLAHQLQPESWPDVSDSHLVATLEGWLQPWLDKVTRLADLKALDLTKILSAQLDWNLSQQLEQLLPTKLQVPSGSGYNIDYLSDPPVLAVKLQEMFGASDTPSVAQGKVPLMLHLLSPAQRPLQVTQDLAGFWRGSYREVQKEMKGRYPKHPWPDKPWEAEPTRFTRHRRK
ncbi:ATP-dependent helicase HrpB [Halieaceae bacterium IMCC14734]|uniref:ATP-dependent helicase HrpB n=2 Tax=Candidatus Litorirhabdus singularis TaxID=2518993 RepID=A0ABT3TGV0_9GAMM|nr:ATP-dependent helicase HrpB [Candidatus Litorirhabdus singularis]